MGRRRPLLGSVRVTILVLALMAVFSMPVCPTAGAASASAKTLQIGVLVAMTGWYSTMDMMEFQEAQAAIELLNERGGITVKGQKYQLELVPEDIKSSLDGTTAAANKLAFDRGLKFVIGPNAFFGPASAPVLEEAQAVHVASFNILNPAEMGQKVPYGFLGQNAVAGSAIAMAKAFKKNYPDAKTACLITPDDGAIPNITPVVKRALKDAGLTMVGDAIGYPNEMVDFSPIAVRANALKTDIIFHQNGIPLHCANITKALRELGNFKPYGGGVGINAPELVSIVGKNFATNVVVVALSPTNTANPPQMQAVIQKLFKKWGAEKSVFFHTANAAWILPKIIEAAQSLDPTDVKKKWESMSTVETLWGMGKIGGTETYGIKNHAVSHPQQYSIIKDGQVAVNDFIMDVTVP